MKNSKGTDKSSQQKASNGVNTKVKREQPRKDSRSKRINEDNMRVDKIKDIRCTNASNDVRWYANNPELLRSAASLPFSTYTGENLTNIHLSSANRGIPGVLVGYWNPSIGLGNEVAINQAADSMYSYVVHANSRNTSYTAEDLMLTVVAGAQLLSFIALGIRLYGVARIYDQRNRYLPDALIRGMGFDPEDIRSNLSRMWFDLNELVARSSQIWIPNTFPFIERWFWMNTNVYMDSNSVKGQFYMFAPNSVFMLNETWNDHGTALTPISIENHAGVTVQFSCLGVSSGYVNTWSDYMLAINTAFSALIESEDRGVMFGDILKAYGPDKIYKLNPVSVDYQVLPVYDIEVLTQIENSRVCPGTPLAIAQNANTAQIYTQWTSVSQAVSNYTINSWLSNQMVLNFHQKETPTPEQIMVATRLSLLGNTAFLKDGKVTCLTPATSGTEIITNWIAIGALWQSGTFTLDLTDTTPNSNVNARTAASLWFWETFDWAPWLYDYTTDIPAAGATINAPIIGRAHGDWDNWTVLDVMTLTKMHTTAVYSEFGVPIM